MHQIHVIVFVIITIEVFSESIDKRCPCVEAELCFVKSNYQTFQAFQAATASCPEFYVRCCSQEMMLLSLIELTNAKQETARRGRQQDIRQNQLPCIKPFKCSEIYGTQAFHFIHITSQNLCPNKDEVRCVVRKLDEETSLPCVHHKQCKRIYGTKPDDFQVYGFMTACLNPSFVRCVNIVNSVFGITQPPTVLTPETVEIDPGNTVDLESIVVTPSSITTDSTTSKPSFVTFSPGVVPDLDSIVITSSPTKSTNSPPLSIQTSTSKPSFVTFSPGVVPDLDSIVITSSPTKSTNSPLFPIQTSTQSTFFPSLQPGVTPDLDSVVICDALCREQQAFLNNQQALLNNPEALFNIQDETIGSDESGQIIVSNPNPNQAPSVTIIGPKPVYVQVADVRGPVIRDDANEREQLKVYLRLARDRLKAYIGGK